MFEWIVIETNVAIYYLEKKSDVYGFFPNVKDVKCGLLCVAKVCKIKYFILYELQ